MSSASGLADGAVGGGASGDRLEATRWGTADWLLLGLASALGAALLFWRLGQGSLADWDEATYAEIAREVYVFRDWIYLHWDFVPWYTKAPLYTWLTALLFHFDVSALVARAVSAAAGVGTIAVTYALARRLYGRAVAVVSVLILAVCYEFVASSRFGTSDGLMTLFTYASLYAFVRAEEGDRRWWYGVGVATGLALMTKDFAALVGPIAILLALALEGRLATLAKREVWVGVALALIIALPWNLLQLARYGGTFVSQYVGYMVVSRATNQIEGHTGSAITYFALARDQFFPWFYLLPFAGLAWIAQWWRDRRRPSIVAVFPALVFILYTLVKSKLSWYLVPIYPAAAVIVGGAAVRAMKGSGPMLAGLGLSVLAGILLVPNSLSPVPRAWTLALVVGLAVGAGAALWRRRSPAGPLAAVALAFMLALAANQLVPLYTLGQSPSELLGARARSQAQPGPILLFIPTPADGPNDNVSHSLVFYSRRPVQVVIGLGQLQQGLGCARLVDVVIPAGQAPLLSGHVSFRPVLQESRFILGVAQERAGEIPNCPAA
ncbi:MAG: ArnT family glycosyltransferase [Candidatus Dormibacteraceae bacterium]